MRGRGGDGPRRISLDIAGEWRGEQLHILAWMGIERIGCRVSMNSIHSAYLMDER